MHPLKNTFEIEIFFGVLAPCACVQLQVQLHVHKSTVCLLLKVSELLKGKVPSDPVMLRFLRAREFNVEKAREMLSQSLIWRKKHGVDKILSEYELPTVIKDYFPGIQNVDSYVNDYYMNNTFILLTTEKRG